MNSDHPFSGIITTQRWSVLCKKQSCLLPYSTCSSGYDKSSCTWINIMLLHHIVILFLFSRLVAFFVRPIIHSSLFPIFHFLCFPLLISFIPFFIQQFLSRLIRNFSSLYLSFGSLSLFFIFLSCL